MERSVHRCELLSVKKDHIIGFGLIGCCLQVVQNVLKFQTVKRYHVHTLCDQDRKYANDE